MKLERYFTGEIIMKKHDIYYSQIERSLKEFSGKKRKIENDSDLSRQGKDKKLAELKTELQREIATVQENFTHAISVEIEKVASRAKPIDSHTQLIENARKKMFETATLFEDISPGDNMRVLVFISAIEGLRQDLQRNNFLMQASNLSSERIQSMAQNYYEQGHIQRLEWLRESVLFKEDSELVLKTINGFIGELEQKALSPSQKIAVQELQLLEKEKTLFDFTVSTAVQRGAFVDVRRGDTGESKVISLNNDFVEQHSEQLTKLARENPQEFMRLQRENKLEQALEEIEETS